MSYCVEFEKHRSVFHSAARWLREKYQLRDSQTIKEFFEKEFEVKIIESQDYFAFPTSIEFKNCKHFTMFLLRFS